MKELRECPICGDPVEIKIKLPAYGFMGVVIECPNCHCMLKNGKCSEHIKEKDRMATPITEKSLAKCLFDTIRIWNNRSNRANGLIDDLGIEPDAETWKRNHWGGEATDDNP